MPGWYVVLKKDARGRRIHSNEEEHSLGQETAGDDIRVLSTMEPQGGANRDDRGGGEVRDRQDNRRRRRQSDNL